MKGCKFLALFIALILIAGCRAPQQRPMDQRPVETNLSAISRTKPVEYCRITADNVTVRNGTGHTFGSIGVLERGDVVRVLGEVDNWYVVQLENNQVGGIEAAKATPVIIEEETKAAPPQAAPNQPAADAAQREDEAAEPNAAPAPPRDLNGEPQLPGGAAEAGNNLAGMAAQMVELVNSERQQNGLPELVVDTEVARVAGIKSQDMVDNNYFSHNSPTYGSPFEMLDSFGIKYLHAGENLAGHQSVQSAHDALMNSAGHRQNILSNDYTHIGIGVRSSDRYGYLFTQLFISKPR